MSRTRLPSLLAAMTLLAAACSNGSAGEPQRPEDPDVAGATRGVDPPFASYVALGDSFTSGPLVPTTDLAGGCFRSDHNYPSILAERLDVVEVTDVSCAGADTSDLTAPQQTVNDAEVPPQLDALDESTDLVTMGIGGNDFHLFSTLVQTCTQLRSADPAGSPCTDRLDALGLDLAATTERISRRVAEAVRRVRERAPEARVVLVGYLRLAPTEGRCKALPFARGDYAQGVRLSRALNQALGRAARRTGATFVDMYAASEGHDVCAREPWVNGARTVEGRALAYHPLAEGMAAVADEVAAALGA